MMEKKTKVFMLVTIVIFIILITAMCYGFFFHSNSEKQEENKTQNQIETQNIQENETNVVEENITKENTIPAEEPPKEIESNNSEVINPNSTIIGKEEAESNSNTTGKSEEEMALELVKEKWGTKDSSVSYAIANREGSIYMISVSSQETTEVLAWYQVNMSTGEVEEQ